VRDRNGVDIRLAPSSETKLPSTFLIILSNLWKWVVHSLKPGEFIQRTGTLGSDPSGEGAGIGNGSTHGSRAIHLLTGIGARTGSLGGGVCRRCSYFISLRLEGRED
jgi:hypothetical protein